MNPFFNVIETVRDAHFLYLTIIALAIFERWKKDASISDEELLNKYRTTGENQFFAELFKRYTYIVYGICMKYFKDKDQCKDEVMQLFEKLLDELKAKHIDNFGHWIKVVAKNHCLMQIRKANLFSQTALDENMYDQIMENPDEMHLILDTEANISLLESGINNISEEQRMCINLFYLQEKSYLEVAQLTGYTLNQVKSYLQNGKRNLYNYMTNANKTI